jgi:hypothetical protein
MQPSENTLQELTRLYEAEFGESLTREEASEMWTRVMDLYIALYRYPREDRGIEGFINSTQQ